MKELSILCWCFCWTLENNGYKQNETLVGLIGENKHLSVAFTYISLTTTHMIFFQVHVPFLFLFLVVLIVFYPLFC